MRPIIVLILCVCGAASVGCSDIAPPPFFNPGPASLQRTRAQRFDPYPDPQMVHDDGSARPRDYLHPPPDADRSIHSLPYGRPLYAPERWQSTGN